MKRRALNAYSPALLPSYLQVSAQSLPIICLKEDQDVGISLTHGLTIAVLVSATAATSGGHLNPPTH